MRCSTSSIPRRKKHHLGGDDGHLHDPLAGRNQTDAVSILVKPDRGKLQTTSRVAGRVNVVWLKRRLSLTLKSTSQNDPTQQDVAKVEVRHH